MRKGQGQDIVGAKKADAETQESNPRVPKILSIDDWMQDKQRAELDELEETAPEEEPGFEPEQVPPPGVTPAEGAAALGHGAMLGGGADLKKSAVRV